MEDWFTIDRIDKDTYSISEYRHWEETHCYLLNGSERSLLIDTGLGICSIAGQVARLTRLPVTAAATHIHWDHIGGHRYYPDFYAHEAELGWLNGGFPQPLETIKGYVTERCQLPEGFSIDDYQFFQGTPSRILRGGERIPLGGRTVQVIHTPGHSPGHMCFWEEERGYLFTGDLAYQGMLAAWFPSTDPQAYLHSLETIARLPAKRVFPGHHAPELPPETIAAMRDALRQLDAEGKLCHGSGVFQWDGWGIQL